MIWLIVANAVVWLVFHYAISALCFIIPLRYFLTDRAFFRLARWEQDGKRWDTYFFVKRWKKHLPEGSSIVKKSYNKRHLHGTSRESLLMFAAETKRAELTHWLLIVPAPLFFLWNPQWAGWVNVVYALLANLPFILTQRYNRGRLERVIARSK